MMEDQTTPNPTPTTPSPADRVRPRVIGLLGGVAAGKSLVAEMLGDLGAEVINADRIAREVLGSPEVCEKLRNAWGPEVFNTQGQPDREKIGEIVFGNPEKRLELNAWIHPETRKRMRLQLDGILQNENATAVIDAPLLIEANLDSWCDVLLYVDTNIEVREARANAARRWSPGEVLRREAGQKPLQEKRARADIVITNNGSREETFAQVERFFRDWIRPQATNTPPPLSLEGEANG